MPFNINAEEREPDPRLRGMNPAFVKSVWKKRTQAVVEYTPRVNVNSVVVQFNPRFRTMGRDVLMEHVERSPFTLEDVTGRSTTALLVIVRQKAMADVYDRCLHLSLSQIGLLFDKDKTCVVKAINRYSQLRKQPSPHTEG